jgi:phage tail sheath protein FI
MEIDRINRSINAACVFDSPRGLNARQATDWHNGIGLYTDNGKLDTYTIALAWNWFTMVDSFTGNRVVVPPSCGALRCLAYTFDAFKPWYAAAGETRGLIPEALAVEFPRVSEDAKQGMYGAGNCLNPIIVNRQRIMLFGNRTTQRRESKLTALNNVILVNTVVKGMSERGRKYIFDPIDDILLAQLSGDFRNLLDGIMNDRGIEEYNLVIDKSNNTAEDRNQRQVNVDLYIIPVDALEKLFINATVRESGATLNVVR